MPAHLQYPILPLLFALPYSQMVAAAGNSALAMFDGSTGDLSKLASQRGPMGVGSARIESEDSGRIRRMYARSQGVCFV